MDKSATESLQHMKRLRLSPHTNLDALVNKFKGMCEEVERYCIDFKVRLQTYKTGLEFVSGAPSCTSTSTASSDASDDAASLYARADSMVEEYKVAEIDRIQQKVTELERGGYRCTPDVQVVMREMISILESFGSSARKNWPLDLEHKVRDAEKSLQTCLSRDLRTKVRRLWIYGVKKVGSQDFFHPLMLLLQVKIMSGRALLISRSAGGECFRACTSYTDMKLLTHRVRGLDSAAEGLQGCTQADGKSADVGDQKPEIPIVGSMQKYADADVKGMLSADNDTPGHVDAQDTVVPASAPAPSDVECTDHESQQYDKYITVTNKCNASTHVARRSTIAHGTVTEPVASERPVCDGSSVATDDTADVVISAPNLYNIDGTPKLQRIVADAPVSLNERKRTKDPSADADTDAGTRSGSASCSVQSDDGIVPVSTNPQNDDMQTNGDSPSRRSSMGATKRRRTDQKAGGTTNGIKAGSRDLCDTARRWSIDVQECTNAVHSAPPSLAPLDPETDIIRIPSRLEYFEGSDGDNTHGIGCISSYEPTVDGCGPSQVVDQHVDLQHDALNTQQDMSSSGVPKTEQLVHGRSLPGKIGIGVDSV